MFQKLKCLLTSQQINSATPINTSCTCTKIISVLNFLLTAFFLAIIYFVIKAEYIRLDVFGSDFFMPINAGYAYSQGLSNNLFTSALGFIYDITNGIAFAIMEKFSISFNKIWILPALIFSISLIIIWSAIRLLTKYKIPYIVLLLAIMTCSGMFNGIVSFSIKGMNYATTYNSQLWIVIFLQMTFLILVLKQSQNLKTISKKDLFVISFIISMFAYITFNYKMNAFVGFCILSSIIIPFLSIKNSIRYIASTVILFLIGNILTAIIFNYDYLFYLNTLKDAVADRPVAQNTFKIFVLGLINTIILMFILNINKFFDSLSKGKNIFRATIDFIPKLSRTTFENLFICTVLSFTIFTVVQGNSVDGGRFYIPSLIIAFFVLTKFQCKKLLFYVLCSSYIVFICFGHIRIFADAQSDNSEKIILENINPNHALKFFHQPQFTKETLTNYTKKYGSILEDSRYYERDNFADLCEVYKKFNMSPNEKIFMLNFISYAPFVINTPHPKPSILFTSPSVSISTKHSKQKVNDLINAADIIVILKKHINNNYSESDFYESRFEDKKGKDYFKFYESDRFIYYAKPQWLKDRNISLIK